MENITITTIQTNLIWENKAANFDNFDKLLADVTQTDVIILPEMFTTGFSMNPKLFAERLFENTFEWMAAKAREKNAVVTGSFICIENGKYYNRLLWMQPDGNYYSYDKRHRFTLAGEDKHYTEGVSRLSVEWRGWQFCPLICYDLRFPAWSRNIFNFNPQQSNVNAAPLYDVLIYVANWPSRRIHHWKALLTGRAIENQAYVIGLNRLGDDGNGIPHSGDSRIVDYYGEVVLDMASTEGVFNTILNKAKMNEYRNKFGFLRDADFYAVNI